MIAAPGVAPGFGFRPGRYGRKVTAGSVSSGMSSLRSCSNDSRLRFTPRERRFFLRVIEVDAEDLLAAIERVLADAQGRILVGLLRESRRRKPAGHGWNSGQKPAATGTLLFGVLHRVLVDRLFLFEACRDRDLVLADARRDLQRLVIHGEDRGARLVVLFRHPAREHAAETAAAALLLLLIELLLALDALEGCRASRAECRAASRPLSEGARWRS